MLPFTQAEVFELVGLATAAILSVEPARQVGEQPRPVPTLGDYDSLLAPLEVSA